MSELKATPGPWHVTQGLNVDAFDREDPELPWSICSTDGGMPDRVQEANAHLIAAAPELYECVEEVATLLKNHGSLDGCNDTILEALERVLAKARGEQQ